MPCRINAGWSFALQAFVDAILAGPPEDVMRKVSPELLRLLI